MKSYSAIIALESINRLVFRVETADDVVEEVLRKRKSLFGLKVHGSFSLENVPDLLKLFSLAAPSLLDSLHELTLTLPETEDIREIMELHRLCPHLEGTFQPLSLATCRQHSMCLPNLKKLCLTAGDEGIQQDDIDWLASTFPHLTALTISFETAESQCDSVTSLKPLSGLTRLEVQNAKNWRSCVEYPPALERISLSATEQVDLMPFLADDAISRFPRLKRLDIPVPEIATRDLQQILKSFPRLSILTLSDLWATPASSPQSPLFRISHRKLTEVPHANLKDSKAVLGNLPRLRSCLWESMIPQLFDSIFPLLRWVQISAPSLEEWAEEEVTHGKRLIPSGQMHVPELLMLMPSFAQMRELTISDLKATVTDSSLREMLASLPLLCALYLSSSELHTRTLETGFSWLAHPILRRFTYGATSSKPTSRQYFPNFHLQFSHAALPSLEELSLSFQRGTAVTISIEDMPNLTELEVAQTTSFYLYKQASLPTQLTIVRCESLASLVLVSAYYHLLRLRGLPSLVHMRWNSIAFAVSAQLDVDAEAMSTLVHENYAVLPPDIGAATAAALLGPLLSESHIKDQFPVAI